MRNCPDDHIGALGEDVTQVLHMGPTTNLTLPHHNLTQNVGLNLDLLAYSLPDGSPGRPFVRTSDDDVDYFDTWALDALQQFQEALVTAAHGLTEFTQKIREWDRRSTVSTRTWDGIARHQRPCRRVNGTEQACPECQPAGATPGELHFNDSLHAMARSHEPVRDF